MGSQTIYAYFTGSRLSTITLPRLSRLEPLPAPLLATHTTGNLGSVTVYGGTRRLWRFTMERVSMLGTSGRATWRQMEALIAHLNAGGAIGLSTDHAKSWAGYTSGSALAGYSYITLTGNAFSTWSNVSPAAGDDVIIEQAPIYGLSECHKVSAYSGSQLTLDGTTLAFQHGGTGTLVRYHGFYPALRLASDQRVAQPLTNEHGISFSLELVLEMDAAVYAPPDDQGIALGLGSSTGSELDIGGSLDALLAQRKALLGGLSQQAGGRGGALGQTAATGPSYAYRQSRLGRF